MRFSRDRRRFIGVCRRRETAKTAGRSILSLQVRYEDEDEDEGPQPDATLEQGAPLPVRLVGTFPPELASVPLEDIDPYYHNQKVSARARHAAAATVTAAVTATVTATAATASRRCSLARSNFVFQNPPAPDPRDSCRVLEFSSGKKKKKQYSV